MAANDNQNQIPPTSGSAQPSKMRNTRSLLMVIVAGLILLAVLSLSYLLFNKPPTTNKAALSGAKVSVTASGFRPATISVKAGTTVDFINNDSQPHQVSADPHPLDNSIPGFDSEQLLQPKDSYSFDFTKPGTYHYHDHLHPYDLKGTVVVK